MFTDPTAYPATEKDITDFDSWTTVKRPALPGRIDRSMVDVIAVTDEGPSGDQTPLGKLLDEDGGEDTDESDEERDGGRAFDSLL